MTSDPKTVTLDDGRTFTVAPGDTLLRAGLRAGLALPYECNVGSCGACRVELTEGQVEAHWPDAPGLTDRDRRRNRVLACQCRPVSDVRIKTHLEARDPRLRPPAMMRARLVEIADITHDIRQFVFKTETPAEFLPGQYALLHLAGVNAPRAYSMANIANAEGLWAFQIRLAPGGQATELLFGQGLAIGEAITLDGPYGLSHLRLEPDRDIVCIAGGSGVAPMLSIARGMAQEPALGHRVLRFFYGARTPKDVCGLASLQALPGFADRIRYEAAVSDPAVSNDWPGWKGFVHDLVADRIGQELSRHEIYLAGPPPMIVALVEMLTADYGVAPQRIHFDRFF